MYLSWTCTAIRLAPIGVLVLVHCSRGHWPSDQEAMERAMDYGFSVDLFPERPTSVITHMFVHVSTQHLLSNVFSLAATLTEFGGITMRANVEEGREEVATQRSIGSLLVMVIGGVCGGLGGQMLYNDSKLHRRRHEVARLRFESTHDGQDVGTVIATNASSVWQRVCDSVSGVLSTVGLGSHADAQKEGVSGLVATTPALADGSSEVVSHSLFGGVKKHIESWRWNFRIWKARTQLELQEEVNNSMLMCGASAGICALAGFNLTYFFRPVTTMCLVVPEVAVLACEVWGTYGPRMDRNATGPSDGGWRTLMPGQTVGHAAHVGGFLVGASLGVFWRRRMLRRKNSVAQRT